MTCPPENSVFYEKIDIGIFQLHTHYKCTYMKELYMKLGILMLELEKIMILLSDEINHFNFKNDHLLNYNSESELILLVDNFMKQVYSNVLN